MSTQNARLIDQANLISLVPSTVSWEQLEPGTFNVAYQVFRSGPLIISARTFNLAFHGHAQIISSKAGVMGIESAADARWRGSDFNYDTIAIGKEELDIRTRGPSTIFSVTVDHDDLGAQFPAAPDASNVVERLAHNKVVCNRPAAARLRAAIKSACARNTVPPSSVSGTLMPLLAATLEDVDGYAVERSHCLNRRYAAVRNCEKYMREHVYDTVSLLDLSQLCGMRSRSLINAFEAITGYSPMHYLKRLRLSGANRMLQLADPRSTRVIDVATEWGFWHMGHFATDYRAMFGEAPSATLSRR